MSESTQNPHIVLVDDEPGVLNALKLLLGAIGFSVSEFIDSLAALEKVSQNQLPDNYVIVSDLRMPSIDGIQLVSSIRQRDIKAPFILMSAHATSEDVAKAKQCGANCFLSKPFTPDQFREAIKSVLLK